MKRLTTIVVLLAVSIIALTAFTGKEQPKQPEKEKSTMYYWFDMYNEYLYRYSTLADETNLTGLDNNPYSPNTIQEFGYTQTSVSGNPPTPISPGSPDQTLYSHP